MKTEPKKTKVMRQNQNPKYDQVLDFKDFEKIEGDSSVRGALKVWDNDAETKENEFIGSATFPLPIRNDKVEDYILDIRLEDGTHRGVVIIQTLLIRDELTVTEKQRMRDRFSKRLGDAVYRRKKRRSNNK